MRVSGFRRLSVRRVASGVVLAVVAALLQGLVLAAPAHAFDIPGDANGHVDVSALLDISSHTCGTLTGGAEDSGLTVRQSSYDYSMPDPAGAASAIGAIDHHWAQDSGGSSLDQGMKFTFPMGATAVDLFPAIDHGPVPGESLESTVYGYDDPAAPSSTWEIGDISTVFDNGWSDWISDDFVSRWEFTSPHRYFTVRWGGPKAMVADGDNEIDALCAPQLAPTGIAAGPDQDVTEGDVVTLSANLVGGSAALGTFHWSLDEASGPAVTLSSPDNATTSFQAPDDGVYHFKVTARAAEETFTDTVVVRVHNAVPVIATGAKPSADDKLAMVTTTLTDPGVVDTHTAHYDWGDGTGVEDLPVLQGSGWGYAYAGHVYAALGHFDVTVTVTDDDGGVSQVSRTTVDVGGAGRATPQLVPSLWAASQTAKFGVDLTGDSTTVDGLVHSNGDIRVAGNTKRLTGGTEYAGRLTVSGSGHVVNPAAVKTAVAPYPVSWLLSDYAPGGPVARRLGAAYVNDSAKCTPSGWQPTAPLSDGVHYVSCDVRIRDGVLDGRKVTLVATGGIDIVTTGDTMTSYDDSVQFISGSGSAHAVKIAGSGTSVEGVVFAPSGGIDVAGSTHTFGCGLLGQNVSISGTGNTFRTANCVYNTQQSNTIPVAAPPAVVPQLSTDVAADRADVAPGGTVGYTAHLTNTGSLLAVPVLYGVADQGTAALRVTGLSASLEYFDETTQQWTPLAATGGRLSLQSRAISSPGTSYTAAVTGTTVSAGSVAAWSGVATVSLTPAEITRLTDPTVVSALRARVVLTTDGTRARVFTRSADNLVDQLRSSGGIVRNGRATLIPAVGDAVSATKAELPALAQLNPGAAATLTATGTLPRPADRQPAETSAGYLARLGALDGRSLVGAAYGDGVAEIGRVLAPASVVRGHQRVARVQVQVVAPNTSTLGNDVALDVRLTNAGTAPATELRTELQVGGLGAIALDGVPGSLAPGASVVAHGVAHPAAAGPIRSTATATWTSPGSTVRFGPTDDAADSQVIAASDHPVTLGSVSGRFFSSAADATRFTAQPTDIPVFSQSFPAIDFNPPAGVLPGAAGADPTTRPFTDVLVGPDAKPAGTLAAAVRDHAAGTGDLSSFQAVFSGVMDVSKAGPMTLSVIADDGFVLGVEGATRGSGPLDGAPSATPFDGLPVLAAHNSAGAIGTYPVTLNFPAAGRYHFELDYFVRAGDSMSLVLTHAGEPGAAGGGRVFLTGHDPDYHAVDGGNTAGARHMIQQAVAYVTGRKSNPKMLLVTDTRNPGSAYIDSRQGMRASGFTTFDVADDGTAGNGVLDLRTVDFGNYDVVVVASDHGGWLRQSELDILNARTADIQRYLQNGGGLVAFAEGSPGAALTSHDRLKFAGCAPTGMDQAESGFKITPQGLAIGLNQSDLNGNFSHNRFDDTCGLDVLDADLAGHVISLATPGTVAGPTRVVPPTNYLLLSPASASHEVGTHATLTASAADAAGDARPGVDVTLDIGAGPDAGTYYGRTDAAGKASFDFVARSAGTEYAYATALIAGDPAVSNAAGMTWTSPTAGGGGGGGTDAGNGATASGLSPADGTRVTAPTDLTATLNPPAGDRVASWRVEIVPAAGGAATTLASGTGTAVAATIDPTVLANGVYDVRIVSVTDAGLRGTSTSTVIVDGEMKLGRYRTTLTDLTVGVAGMPIQVQRSYDSFDKAKGDFGVGWHLDLADFQVSANGPLGDGGWKMASCGGGLIFATLCFTADRPHFVTVTWPDGHNEYFDLTPAQGSTFFTGLTSAQFTARPGSTSKLAAVDSDLFWVNGNLNGGSFGTGGAYDPTAFVLTDKYGTRYTLEVGAGLMKVEDKLGNVTTFGRNGITSSNGPSVTFTRNTDDAITRVTGPDGKSVQYGYDANGDLVSVTNQLGKVTTLSYLTGHYLDRVIGPDSAVTARFEYQDGRVVAVVDGDDNRTEISSDIAGRQETVTDPGGKRTTVRTYNSDGLLAGSDEIYGGQHHATAYGYDDKRNMTFRRDPAGHEWHATYVNGSITSLEQPSGATTTITYNSLGLPQVWTDPEGHVTTYTWNPDGTLAGIEDALGHSETYTYTGGKRTGMVDRNGKAWIYTYNAAGLLQTTRNPLGDVTSYEYDANGHRTAVVDALGHRTETTYDAAGKVRTTKDADGKVSESVYDDLQRLVRAIDPTGAAVDHTLDDAGRTTKIDNHVDAPTTIGYDAMGRETSRKVGTRAARASTYDGAGNVLTSTDEVGRTTTNTYYLDGTLHTTVNPAGGVTTYTYHPDGQIATQTDPRGKVTRYTYWPSGRLRTTTDPAGATTGYAYDATGHLTVTTFADGTTQERRYDPVGNVIKQIDQEGDATVFEYDDAGRVTAQVDGEGRRTEFVVDKAGRTTGVKAPGGGVSVRTFSPAGRLESETTSQGVTKTYAYDGAGRRITTTDELGHVWSTSYDAAGRVLTQRDPRQQGAGPATVTNAYDSFGNLVSTTDALGDKVVFGYDAAGQRTSVTDPRGKTWSVAYDALGGPGTETDPLGRTRTSDYDLAGLLRQTVDARGVTVAYAYDDTGRVTSMSQQGGTGSVSYAYDSLGRRASMTDPSGQTMWAYYPDGATKRITSAAGAVSYAYDRSGLRTSMTTPAGTATYAYDTAGMLDKVVDAKGRTFDLGVDSDGRVRSLARPNGVTTTWAYDDASRLTGVTHKRGTTVVDSASNVLDADGNRTGLTTPQGQESYTLDAADQLTSVTYPDGTTTTYTYDAAGNRLTSKTGSAAAVAYSYDDASELASVGGSTVAHDRAGHVTAARGTTYDWDWLGRMIAVDGPAVPGGRASYTYDGDGVRVSQSSDSSGREALLYDRLAGDGSPDLVRDGDEDFLHLLGGVVEADGTDLRYPLADGLGSVRTVTAADGSTIGTTAYDAFGAVRNSSGATTAFGFTGAPQAGDLVHLGVRDLDTAVGRFTSTDPVRPGAPGSVGWNPYAYVANNPTTSVDPTGAFVAGEYATISRTTSAALVATLPRLAFAIVQQYAVPGAVIGIAALVTVRSLPDVDIDPNDDAVDAPDDRPIPIPFPIPWPQTETTNKPRPGDCSYDGPSWYNYWGPNSRPTGADACLKAPLGGGSAPGYDPPGWQSGAGYDRGHIIARRLGGSGSEPGSLFTQCLGVNRGAMRVFEGEVFGKANSGETIYYVVALGYFGRTIPDTVSAFYAGNHGSAGTATFSNVC